MRLRFHGVRGSVPWGVAGATRHGCNTPCLELTNESTGDVLILDAGSGVAGATPPAGRPVSMLFTHYHWDHVLGLPYFAPFYDPAATLTLHAPALADYDSDWLTTVFRAPFNPVPYDTLANHPVPELVRPGPVAIDGFDVCARPLHHPGGSFAYRIKGPAGDVVYATDHEFGNQAVDEALGDFIRGAAHVVLDAHFTPEELPAHAGWGHGDWRQCAEFAAAHDVGQLWLFHHKPGRTDDELDAIERLAQRVFPKTRATCDGDEITF